MEADRICTFDKKYKITLIHNILQKMCVPKKEHIVKQLKAPINKLFSHIA